MKLRAIDNVVTTDLKNDLTNHEFALGYLQAALDEAQVADDIGVFLVALRDVIKATGSVAQVAKQAGATRASFYKSLSEGGNPQIETIMRALPALGMRLQVVSARVGQAAKE